MASNLEREKRVIGAIGSSAAIKDSEFLRMNRATVFRKERAETFPRRVGGLRFDDGGRSSAGVRNRAELSLKLAFYTGARCFIGLSCKEAMHGGGGGISRSLFSACSAFDAQK